MASYKKKRGCCICCSSRGLRLWQLPFLCLNEQLAEPTPMMCIAIFLAGCTSKKNACKLIMRTPTRCLVPDRGLNLPDSRPPKNKALINAFSVNASPPIRSAHYCAVASE